MQNFKLINRFILTIHHMIIFDLPKTINLVDVTYMPFRQFYAASVGGSGPLIEQSVV